MNQNCCEKCKEYAGNAVIPHCVNSQCPCHSPRRQGQTDSCLQCGRMYPGHSITCPVVSQEKQDKIKAGAKDFAERFEPVMRELAEEEKQACTRCEAGVCSAHQPSAEWEEEVFGWLNTNLTPQALVNKIRPLVRKVVEQARERGETSAGRDNYRHAEKEGRTAALKGVVEKINKILMQHGTFEDPLTDTLSDLKQSITSLLKEV